MYWYAQGVGAEESGERNKGKEKKGRKSGGSEREIRVRG